MKPDFTTYKSEDFLAEETFVNYLLQKNKEDVAFWKEWVATNTACQQEVQKAKQLFFLLKENFLSINTDDEFKKLQSQIADDGVTHKEPSVDLKPKVSFNSNGKVISLFKAVTSIAAIFLVMYLVWPLFKKEEPSQEFALYAQSEGRKRTVRLPDGSKVVLNRGARIDLPKDFNRQNRRVKLQGAAFFDVQPDKERPFTVISDEVQTTALGTSFYINNPFNTEPLTISLLEGKVIVESEKKAVELISGEKAVYKDGQHLIKEPFNKSVLQAWVEGKIIFKQARIEEIKSTVSEYFGKSVKLVGNVPEISFTGEFSSDNLESILQSLQFTYDIQYKVDDKQVILSFQ